MNESLELHLRMLPESPGCYLMKRGDEIIYVGKAINLKNRVRSYFQSREHTPKVAAMVGCVDDFDIMLCSTNLEALILECNLIKLHKPYYNILLKDDKHYPYIRIDRTVPFPRVTVARRMGEDKARYFGPYIGATAVRDVIEVLRKVFPVRTCDLDLPLKRPIRPCIQYEIGRCLAPCAGLCSAEEYGKIIAGVTDFLNGHYKQIADSLTLQMQAASAAMNFERAARLRDNIRDIRGLMERQSAIQTNSAQQDILAIAQDGLDAMAQVLFVRGGHMVGGENFALPREGNEPPEDVLAAFMLQYYDSRLPAREVIIPALPDADTIEGWLREKRGAAVSLTQPLRGDKHDMLLLAAKNAKDALDKRNAHAQVRMERTVGACRLLADALGLQATPRRIEGFDISNTQGALSVASMVVFIDGDPARGEYRHFRIKTVTGANDFASMNEVLGRRFKRAAAESEKDRWVMPDLVLIDGGPEQLAFALRAMKDAGVYAPMFGLAKRLEEIYLPDTAEPIILDRHSPALHLIQRIRDEAHRFAITHHRNLRGKAAVHSTLEDIPGIGAARRRALLANFRTMKGIREADVTALRAVEGMTRAAAEAVYNAMHAGEQGTAARDAPLSINTQAGMNAAPAARDTPPEAEEAHGV
jgi:excinuclease ABC subunit C